MSDWVKDKQADIKSTSKKFTSFVAAVSAVGQPVVGEVAGDTPPVVASKCCWCCLPCINRGNRTFTPTEIIAKK